MGGRQVALTPILFVLERLVPIFEQGCGFLTFTLFYFMNLCLRIETHFVIAYDVLFRNDGLIYVLSESSFLISIGK